MNRENRKVKINSPVFMRQNCDQFTTLAGTDNGPAGSELLVVRPGRDVEEEVLYLFATLVRYVITEVNLDRTDPAHRTSKKIILQ